MSASLRAADESRTSARRNPHSPGRAFRQSTWPTSECEASMAPAKHLPPTYAPRSVDRAEKPTKPAPRSSFPNAPNQDERGEFSAFLNLQRTASVPVLIAFMTERLGARIADLPDLEVQERVMRVLRLMFGNSIPAPMGFVRTRWERAPFALGSYAYFPVDAGPGDFELLAEPVGRIHFAGEATIGDHDGMVHSHAFRHRCDSLGDRQHSLASNLLDYRLTHDEGTYALACVIPTNPVVEAMFWQDEPLRPRIRGASAYRRDNTPLRE